MILPVPVPAVTEPGDGPVPSLRTDGGETAFRDALLPLLGAAGERHDEASAEDRPADDPEPSLVVVWSPPDSAAASPPVSRQPGAADGTLSASRAPQRGPDATEPAPPPPPGRPDRDHATAPLPAAPDDRSTATITGTPPATTSATTSAPGVPLAPGAPPANTDRMALARDPGPVPVSPSGGSEARPASVRPLPSPEAGGSTVLPLAPPAVGLDTAVTAAAEPPARGGESLVQRILEVVELLEHRPPPRQLTLEVGDTRLRIALDADGHVRLALLGTDAPDAEALLDEARGALEQRGFSSGGGDHRAPQDQPGPDPDRSTPNARPGRRSADGLRL
jgi:hypothetical protein